MFSREMEEKLKERRKTDAEIKEAQGIQ